jgi:hypothetical protein
VSCKSARGQGRGQAQEKAEVQVKSRDLAFAMPLLDSPLARRLRPKILLASATAAAPKGLHQQRTFPCCTDSNVAVLGLMPRAGMRLFVQVIQSVLRDSGVGCLVLRPGHTWLHEHFCLLPASTSCIPWQIAVRNAVDVAPHFELGTQQYSAHSLSGVYPFSE